MEFYAQLFGPILPYLKEYWLVIVIGVPLLIAIIVLTRRYSVPLIVFLIEFVVYSTVMHAVVHVGVRIFSWFKNTSSMKMVRDPDDYVDWQTPLLRFWDMDVYNPGWIIGLEAVFIIIILALMYRFQPLKPQYKHKSRFKKYAPAPAPSGRDDGWGTPRKFTGSTKPAAPKNRRTR